MAQRSSSLLRIDKLSGKINCIKNAFVLLYGSIIIKRCCNVLTYWFISFSMHLSLTSVRPAYGRDCGSYLQVKTPCERPTTLSCWASERAAFPFRPGSLAFAQHHTPKEHLYHCIGMADGLSIVSAGAEGGHPVMEGAQTALFFNGSAIFVPC